MLESLQHGEGKYIPTLRIQKDKLLGKCSQIADVIYKLDSHSIDAEDNAVATMLKDEVKNGKPNYLTTLS